MNDIKYGRKRSGITKELSRKVHDWLSSIKDDDVRKLAEKNTIVTGGAIASMLLGEKVNDFDIYFRDKATTLAVAKYYVEKYSKKSGGTDIQVIEKDCTNIKGQIEQRVILSIPSSGICEEKGKKRKSKYSVSFMSENAITLTGKVQLVTRFYGSPTEIHDNYDFVHAMCYWDHANLHLELSADAMESMLSRTLHYSGSLYPIASIFRMKKFIERGWRISAGQQLKIMWQISEINLSDPEILREQLTGVDQLYMQALVNALQGVDSEKINSTYVGSIIDKIFH